MGIKITPIVDLGIINKIEARKFMRLKITS